eukprot:366025-Chlamydomonas_euryale.AAC.8
MNARALTPCRAVLSLSSCAAAHERTMGVGPSTHAMRRAGGGAAGALQHAGKRCSAAAACHVSQRAARCQQFKRGVVRGRGAGGRAAGVMQRHKRVWVGCRRQQRAGGGHGCGMGARGTLACTSDRAGAGAPAAAAASAASMKSGGGQQQQSRCHQQGIRAREAGMAAGARAVARATEEAHGSAHCLK